jgi:hypothetical protein
VVDAMNCHKIDEKYQINNALNSFVSAKILCNQIIHSFVWIWCVDVSGTTIDSFLINSDKTKHKKLYLISLEEFNDFTQKVANSNPTEMTGVRNSKNGQWEFKSR